MCRRCPHPASLFSSAGMTHKTARRGVERKGLREERTFLWNTGLVCPPKPICFESYRLLPWANDEALPALYWVTCWDARVHMRFKPQCEYFRSQSGQSSRRGEGGTSRHFT